MQPDDIGFLEWGFKGAVGVIFTVGGWMWVKLMNAVVKNKDDLAEHKLHVSDTYAKKTELSPIYEAVAEIRGDVKELLGRKRERDP